ncbi:uncharacterized protein LOC112573354 isoform X2 [Pomacea canaliculata]|uniref:uncharacterized protein LOC112573354 isoform X2 n=1 Tax=Pomacea canaliculata TaxID=400727 RepID=UPI000D7291A6|nr:uncharacterized protein LOC112573354 isoform X2 [Pomacea canaliculata]
MNNLAYSMFASTERDVLINMTTDDDIIINLTTDSNIVISSTTSDITSRSLDDVERWMLGLMGVVVWINGVVGNILILVTLYCQPLLRSTHNIFLGNLALADLFIVGYGQPFWVVDVISGIHPTVNSWHCTINGYLGFVCSVASIVTLWTISCNRYLSICHHAIYQRLVNTKKRAFQICLGLWIGSALFGSIPLFGPGSFGYESVTRTCFLKRTWWENKQRIGLWHSKSTSNHGNLVDVETREYKIERPEEAAEQNISMKREHARCRTKNLVSMQKKVQVMKTNENIGQWHMTDEFMNNIVVQNNVMAEPQIIRKNIKSKHISTGAQTKAINHIQDQEHTRTHVCREKKSLELEDIPTNNNATDESEEQEEQLKGHGKSSECGRQFERKEHVKSVSEIGDQRESHTEIRVAHSGNQGVMVADEQKHSSDQKTSTTSGKRMSDAVVISVCELVALVANKDKMRTASECNMPDEEMLDSCSEKATCNPCKRQLYSPSDEGILISNLITGGKMPSSRTAKGTNSFSDNEARPGNKQGRWNSEYQKTNITKKQKVITDSQKEIHTIHEQKQTTTSNQQSCSGLKKQNVVNNLHLERIPLGYLRKCISQGQEGRNLSLKKGDLEEDKNIASIEIMTKVQNGNTIENQVQDGIQVQETNTRQNGAKDDEQRKRLIERNAKKSMEKQTNNEVEEAGWSCGEYSTSNDDFKYKDNVYHHCCDYRCRKIWHTDRCSEKLESGNASGTRIKISSCLWEPKPEDKCEQTIGKNHLSRDEKQQEESVNQEQPEDNQRPVKCVRLIQRHKALTINEQNDKHVERHTANKRTKPVQSYVEEISRETLDGKEQNLESWDRQPNTFENLVEQKQEQQKIKQKLMRMTQEQMEEKPLAKKHKKERPIEESLAERNKRFKWSFWHINNTKETVRQKEEERGKQITFAVAVKPTDIALMRSLLAVYVCLLLIYAAIVVVDVARAITYVPPTVTVTTNLLFFVNSSINWLLYGAFSYQFRLAYRRQLCQWTQLCCTCT